MTNESLTEELLLILFSILVFVELLGVSEGLLTGCARSSSGHSSFTEWFIVVAFGVVWLLSRSMPGAAGCFWEEGEEEEIQRVIMMIQ